MKSLRNHFNFFSDLYKIIQKCVPLDNCSVSCAMRNMRIVCYSIRFKENKMTDHGWSRSCAHALRSRQSLVDWCNNGEWNERMRIHDLISSALFEVHCKLFFCTCWAFVGTPKTCTAYASVVVEFRNTFTRFQGSQTRRKMKHVFFVRLALYTASSSIAISFLKVALSRMLIY